MDYKTFIKKHTTLNADFVEEFLSFYNPEVLNTDMIIDLEKISYWLNTRKRKLKETLKNSYIKNIDYKVIPTPIKGKAGGALKEQILLTPDCFKRLCLLSKTPNADKVRTYFIQLENLMIKYRIEINAALEEKIRKLENNNKKIENVKKGMIYVFKVSDIKTEEEMYKIGKTINMYKRSKIYNTGLKDNIEILSLYEVNNLSAVDKCIKAFLDKYRYRKSKEVFKVNLDLIKKVIKKCKKIDLSMLYKSPNKIESNEDLMLYIETKK
jgi:hypothetical protein